MSYSNLFINELKQIISINDKMRKKVIIGNQNISINITSRVVEITSS